MAGTRPSVSTVTMEFTKKIGEVAKLSNWMKLPDINRKYSSREFGSRGSLKEKILKDKLPEEDKRGRSKSILLNNKANNNVSVSVCV